MNTGQMMLTAGAMVLLGSTILTVNKNTLNQGTILRQTQLGIYSVSLATSYIEKATGLAFDEATEAGSLDTNAENILSTTLGIDAGAANLIGPTEWAGKDSSFDDFDDYNGFNIDTTINNVDRFHVVANVFYLSTSPPYTRTTTRTFLKQMDIAVSSSVSRKVFEDYASSASKAGTDTIKLSVIQCYFR